MPYCTHCKTIKNLMPRPYAKNKRKSGKVAEYYMCRFCNNERIRKYRQTEVGKKKIKDLLIRQKIKFPEKTKARAMLNSHIQSGEIIKPKLCESCSLRKALDGHHEDYDKPLIVEWLCRNCHTDRHREIVEVSLT